MVVAHPASWLQAPATDTADLQAGPARANGVRPVRPGARGATAAPTGKRIAEHSRARAGSPLRSVARPRARVQEKGKPLPQCRAAHGHSLVVGRSPAGWPFLCLGAEAFPLLLWLSAGRSYLACVVCRSLVCRSGRPPVHGAEQESALN